MFAKNFQKLDAFGVQDCGLTGDSCGQPLYSHKPGYWYNSTAKMSRQIKVVSLPSLRACICTTVWGFMARFANQEKRSCFGCADVSLNSSG